MEYERDGDTDFNKYTRNNPKRHGKGTGTLVKKQTSENHPNFSIIKINENTEKSPGAMWKLAVAQTRYKTNS